MACGLFNGYFWWLGCIISEEIVVDERKRWVFCFFLFFMFFCVCEVGFLLWGVVLALFWVHKVVYIIKIDCK